MATIYSVIHSPIGSLILGTDGTHLTQLRMENARYFEEIPTDWVEGNHHILKTTANQLNEYFTGERKEFDLPLSLAGTAFQQKVWQALLTVPFGSKSTYTEISHRIDNPKAIRAVGSAIGRNPVCIVIPCHRILASNGSLVGFAGGLDRKRALLKLES